MDGLIARMRKKIQSFLNHLLVERLARMRRIRIVVIERSDDCMPVEEGKLEELINQILEATGGTLQVIIVGGQHPIDEWFRTTRQRMWHRAGDRKISPDLLRVAQGLEREMLGETSVDPEGQMRVKFPDKPIVLPQRAYLVFRAPPISHEWRKLVTERELMDIIATFVTKSKFKIVGTWGLDVQGVPKITLPLKFDVSVIYHAPYVKRPLDEEMAKESAGTVSTLVEDGETVVSMLYSQGSLSLTVGVVSGYKPAAVLACLGNASLIPRFDKVGIQGSFALQPILGGTRPASFPYVRKELHPALLAPIIRVDTPFIWPEDAIHVGSRKSSKVALALDPGRSMAILGHEDPLETMAQRICCVAGATGRGLVVSLTHRSRASVPDWLVPVTAFCPVISADMSVITDPTDLVLPKEGILWLYFSHPVPELQYRLADIFAALYIKAKTRDQNKTPYVLFMIDDFSVQERRLSETLDEKWAALHTVREILAHGKSLYRISVAFFAGPGVFQERYSPTQNAPQFPQQLILPGVEPEFLFRLTQDRVLRERLMTWALEKGFSTRAIVMDQISGVSQVELRNLHTTLFNPRVIPAWRATPMDPLRWHLAEVPDTGPSRFATREEPPADLSDLYVPAETPSSLQPSADARDRIMEAYGMSVPAKPGTEAYAARLEAHTAARDFVASQSGGRAWSDEMCQELATQFDETQAQEIADRCAAGERLGDVRRDLSRQSGRPDSRRQKRPGGRRLSSRNRR